MPTTLSISDEYFVANQALKANGTSSKLPILVLTTEISYLKTTYTKVATHFWHYWPSVTIPAPMIGQGEGLPQLIWTLGAFCGYGIDSVCSLEGAGVRCRKRMIEAHNLGTGCWHQLVISVLCGNRWLSRYNGVGKVRSSRAWAGLLPSYIIII